MPAMTARTRWLIGGGVAALAIVIALAAALILSSRQVPEAMKYVPGNSVLVGELRLDLPGDQLQRVGNLLSHFPGFKDQSTLAAKIDETLSRLVRDASNGKTDYATKVKPWLAGPTFVGVLPIPAGSAASSNAPVASPGSSPTGQPSFGSADGVIVATTDGTATCDSAISGGTTRSIPQGSMLIAASGDMACFMDGKFGLLGTPAGIEAALAAHAAGTGIDRDAQYAKARDTLGGDRLATMYVSGAAAQLMQAAEASLPTSLPISLPTAGSLPEWLIAGVRAEDDALISDVWVAPAKPGATASPIVVGSPLPTLPTLPPPHPSAIAGFLPGNTVALAELHGVGVSAQAALAAIRSDPQFQAAASQLDAALGLAGGPEGVVGWISDAGVVVIPQSGTPAAGAQPGLDVGLVLVATDEATATAKATQLKSLLSLAGLSSGGSMDEVNVGGTTVTTVDLGNLSSLIGQAGGANLGGLTIPPDLHLKLSLAVRGKLVLLGGDDGFARDVLQVEAGSTLADQDAYKRSLDRASASNLGQVYVAGDSLRQLAAQFLPADLQARWQADFLPYAQPVDAILLTSTIENGLSHTRIVITVSTPSPTPSTSP